MWTVQCSAVVVTGDQHWIVSTVESGDWRVVLGPTSAHYADSSTYSTHSQAYQGGSDRGSTNPVMSDCLFMDRQGTK